ncbi:MAG: PAS domain-containing sensor histidine kinase [Myxococcales bacterium]
MLIVWGREVQPAIPIPEAQALGRALDQVAADYLGPSVEREAERRPLVGREVPQATVEELRRQAKEARDAADRARAQLAAVLDAVPGGVGVLDERLRFEQVNDELARMDGVSAREHGGREIAEVLPGDLGFRMARDFEHVLRSRESLRNHRVSMPVPTRPRERREWQVHCSPVIGPGGELLGASAVVLDVTEQVAQSEELRAARRERGRAVEAFDELDPCFVLDKDFRVVLANRAQERITRVSGEQAIGHSFWELLPSSVRPGSECWQRLHEVLRKRVEARFEHNLAPDLWAEVRARPTQEGGVAVLLADITERKRCEQLCERLAGIVGRDLRSPLGAITLSANLMLQRGETLPAFALAAARRISTSADRMARMIGQLHDFTRARMPGGLPIARRPTNLCEIARAVVDELAVLHPGQIELSCPTVGVRGEWDPERLFQVLSNLVSNALEHGAEGMPVELVLHNQANQALIEVRNQGTPIPADVLSRLFDPFHRVGADHPGSGLGLGLYIVQQILRAHGGAIEVRSTASEGTVFRVRFPKVPVDEFRR